jgi:hypothetical protein
MDSMKGWGRAVAGLGILLVAGCVLCAQYVPGSAPSTRIQTLPRPGYGDGPDLDPLSEAKRMKALNTDRHKSMVSDAEKLVNLARQLDAEIASNPTDELTARELQKVAAIEKLAHNVKTKMAQSFGGGPELRSPLIDIGGPNAP